MTSSIERDVENAIAQALTTAGVTGVNIYTSERTSGRLLPFVSIVASIKSEEIAPFTGVFDLNCTITYVARADTISDQAYDQKFASIQQAFYTNPNLASQMTSAQNDLEFYIADITRVGQRIISTSRTWARDVFMDVKVTTIQSPIPISGLSLWLKADAGVTLSGSNVTAWADQSGNGNNAVTNIGEEPTFVSSFLNNKPAIQFNGDGQIVEIADSNSLDFINTSAFIVLRYLGQGTGNNIVYIKNANAGSPENEAMYGLVATNGGNVSFSQNVDGWSDHQTQIDIQDSIPRILSMTYDGTNQNVYSNGNFSNTFFIGGNIATSTGTLQIGGYNKSFDGEEYFYGQIAEIIMYNRAVTEAERQQVEAYLNTKYAIY
jgi:hypothetical protein